MFRIGEIVWIQALSWEVKGLVMAGADGFQWENGEAKIESKRSIA